MTAVRPDLLVAERYRLAEPIASGGMGQVWRAVDERLRRAVAVKILRAEYADDPAFVERFRAEGRHAAMLSHPGIAGVYDYGEVGGMAYLVMELVDGEPLSRVLAREGRLPTVRVLDVIGQAALALQAAHDAGVVHRDVKPANLLVRPDGVVKVTDFGIARAVDAVPLTRTGTVLGTAHYLSPEQGSGAEVTPRSDVYSLGVVAFECLAGRRPFDADNPLAIVRAHADDSPPPLPDEVPGPVRVLVEQALEKDPARRPISAGEFGRTALALRAALTSAPVAAPYPAEPPPATRPSPTQPYTGLVATPAPDAPPQAASPPAGRPAHRPAWLTRPPLRPIPRPAWSARGWLVAALVLALLVAALVLRACSAAGGPARAVLPNVTGHRLAAAKHLLAVAGFDHVTTHTVSTTRHAAGTVVSEAPKPAAGKRIDTSTTVSLAVAARPTTVTVDPSSYVGQPLDVARSRLQRLGLSVTVDYVASGGAPGTVAGVYPTGNVRAGSTVTLSVVAAAPPPPRHGGGHDHGHGKGEGG